MVEGNNTYAILELLRNSYLLVLSAGHLLVVSLYISKKLTGQ